MIEFPLGKDWKTAHVKAHLMLSLLNFNQTNPGKGLGIIYVALSNIKVVKVKWELESLVGNRIFWLRLI